MNRRDQDRGRRPAKRSRSPDERDRSPREDKRRRPHDHEKEREPPTSPRATRHTTRLHGRDDRSHREDEDRRERDSRSRNRRGNFSLSWSPSFPSNRQDEQSRYDRDARSVNSTSKPGSERIRTDRKLPALDQSSTEPKLPAKPQVITAKRLLEELEENEPPLSKVLGFSGFKTTKGKKHVDYGGVQLIKKRKYRQYMNRPGGFNRPIDAA